MIMWRRKLLRAKRRCQGWLTHGKPSEPRSGALLQRRQLLKSLGATLTLAVAALATGRFIPSSATSERRSDIPEGWGEFKRSRIFVYQASPDRGTDTLPPARLAS